MDAGDAMDAGDRRREAHWRSALAYTTCAGERGDRGFARFSFRGVPSVWWREARDIYGGRFPAAAPARPVARAPLPTHRSLQRGMRTRWTLNLEKSSPST